MKAALEEGELQAWLGLAWLGLAWLGRLSRKCPSFVKIGSAVSGCTVRFMLTLMMYKLSFI